MPSQHQQLRGWRQGGRGLGVGRRRRGRRGQESVRPGVGGPGEHQLPAGRLGMTGTCRRDDQDHDRRDQPIVLRPGRWRQRVRVL